MVWHPGVLFILMKKMEKRLALHDGDGRINENIYRMQIERQKIKKTDCWIIFYSGRCLFNFSKLFSLSGMPMGGPHTLKEHHAVPLATIEWAS